MVRLDHRERVGVHERAVRLEVDNTIAREDFPVHPHEAGARQPFVHLLHLRVGERDPDLGHLARREEVGDQLDAGAQESHVGHPAFQRFFRACPHTRSFDVHANEVLLGEELAQPHGVFSFPATQFQHDRVVVVEETLVPMPFHVEALFLQGRERILEYMREARHIVEFR